MNNKAIDRHVQVTDLVNGGTELMTATAWITSHAALTRAVRTYVDQHPAANYEIGGTVDAGSIQLDEGPQRLHIEWKSAAAAAPAVRPPRRADHESALRGPLSPPANEGLQNRDT